MMLSLVGASALFTTVHALTCLVGTGEKKADHGPTCVSASHVNVCFRPITETSASDFGCVPLASAGSMDYSEAGCSVGANWHFCWCLTNDCNTAAWVASFSKTYVAPPQCYSGIAGAKLGATCGKSTIYTANEYKKAEEPSCSSRAMSGPKCIENNKGFGQGDGCSDDAQNTEAPCEAYKTGTRKVAESHDGTTKHCRWLLAITDAQKTEKCNVDDKCTWSTSTSNCQDSTTANTKDTEWQAKRGVDCEKRLKFGCFENNGHLGEMDRCKKMTTSATCDAVVDSCSEGSCSGTATGGMACASPSRESKDSCAPSSDSQGCTWTSKCCQWLATPADVPDTCANTGKGTLDGVCTYNDGEGPPAASILDIGFNYGLFMKKDKFLTQCAVMASFRVGFGSAAVIGSDMVNFVDNQCTKMRGPWDGVAKHIGHTNTTITEYCTNLIPETSAMATIKKYTPSFLVTKAEQGQFGAVFSGLSSLLFIVISKPAYGKCLFTADPGKWGAGICICDTKECNGKAALTAIVDPLLGPMRLLQFIDGSLVSHATKVNGIVPDLMDAKGNIIRANVAKVTEANVIAIVALDGWSAFTNKVELWGLVQAFQALLTAEAAYKAVLMEDASFKALKIDPTKVAAANAAAGVVLYGADGVPNTFALELLSSEKLAAVATATGLAVADLETGKTAVATFEASIDSNSTSGKASALISAAAPASSYTPFLVVATAIILRTYA